MSRHRNLRHLDTNDYQNDWDHDDYDDATSAPVNDPELLARLPPVLARVRNLLAGAVDDDEIKETLLYYALDESKTVRWLLEGVDSDAIETSPKSLPSEPMPNISDLHSSILTTAFALGEKTHKNIKSTLLFAPAELFAPLQHSTTPTVSNQPIVRENADSNQTNLNLNASDITPPPETHALESQIKLQLTPLSDLGYAFAGIRQTTIPTLNSNFNLVNRNTQTIPYLFLARDLKIPTKYSTTRKKLQKSKKKCSKIYQTPQSIFLFDRASPDDIVRAARAKMDQSQNSNSTNNPSEISSPPNESTELPASQSLFMQNQSPTHNSSLVNKNQKISQIPSKKAGNSSKTKNSNSTQTHGSTNNKNTNRKTKQKVSPPLSSSVTKSSNDHKLSSSQQIESKNDSPNKKKDIKRKENGSKSKLNIVSTPPLDGKADWSLTDDLGALKLEVNQEIEELEMLSSDSLTRLGKRNNKRITDVEIAEECKNRGDRLTFVVAGHVDAGKSTLIGHLLFLRGKVDSRTMKRYERESAAIGKSSFSFAWVLDSRPEERTRGVTVEVASASFVGDAVPVSDAPPRIFTVLDAPGHRDYVPNMLLGASKADAALLVVDARPGEFEVGHSGGGQTREHLMLLRAVGVSHVVVAVNKMDAPMVDWSQDRFSEIDTQVRRLLLSIGYSSSVITVVPCSGLSGDNLIDPSSNTAANWYSGTTLLRALENIPVSKRDWEQPLRIAVGDHVIGGAGGNDVTFYGQVSSGNVALGDTVLVMPTGQICTVRSITDTSGVSDDPDIGSSSSLALYSASGETSVNFAVAGDHVAVGVRGIDDSQLGVAGMVLCPVEHPIPAVISFEAKILMFDTRIPLTHGYAVMFHLGATSEPANVTKLVSIIDKTTGKPLPKRPRCIAPGAIAIVQITLQRPVCLESMSTGSRAFSRFILRNACESIAAGKVTDILLTHTPLALADHASFSSFPSIASSSMPELVS